MRQWFDKRLSNLRSDKYGIYFWSVRFVVQLMWPLRFWQIRRQRDLPYNGGNISLGPLYVAWYDEAATVCGSKPTNPKWSNRNAETI